MKEKKSYDHSQYMQKRASNKIQYSVLIKALNKVAVEKSYLNIIKIKYDELTASIILN